MNIDFNTTFLTHTRKKVLKYLKYRRTIIYSDMHSWKIKCKVVAKLFNILQSFYLLTFRLKSAPSNRYLFLPLLNQTPVNKSESFNDRLNESEIANEALSHDSYRRLKRNNNQMTVSEINKSPVTIRNRKQHIKATDSRLYRLHVN